VHFLVIDDRFPSPVYVFLDADPRQEEGFPGLPVFQVNLERPSDPGGSGWDGGVTPAASVGRYLGDPARFREFGSDRAVDTARYQLVEPRYVGPTWKAYVRHFRPGGR
jgi:hypothetical protein